MSVRELLSRLFTKPARWQRVFAAVLLVALISTLLFVGSQPSSGGLFAPPLDKLVHLIFFGGVAVLAYVALDSRRPLHTIVLAAGLGLIDEVGQSFNPARVPSVADWLMDLAGACLAVLLIRVLVKVLRSK